MIRGYKNKATAELASTGKSKKFSPELWAQMMRKLSLLDHATTLGDLMQPPGNRLESLWGNRRGYHSIRINSQWRICFMWHKNDAYEVEIVDYH